VHNAFFVQFTNSNDDLSTVKLDDVFSKSLVFLKDLVELATIDKRHDKIKASI